MKVARKQVCGGLYFYLFFNNRRAGEGTKKDENLTFTDSRNKSPSN